MDTNWLQFVNKIPNSLIRSRIFDYLVASDADTKLGIRSTNEACRAPSPNKRRRKSKPLRKKKRNCQKDDTVTFNWDTDWEATASESENKEPLFDDPEYEPNPDGIRYSKYDIYDNDRAHPFLVQLAQAAQPEMIHGYLNLLQNPEKIIFDYKCSKFQLVCNKKMSNKDFKQIINACRTRTEIVEKYGYDKSWEWHDDTALHAAVRSNSSKSIYYLLKFGADPTLQSGHDDDYYPSPLELAKNLKRQNCVQLLETAMTCWRKAKYADARAQEKNQPRTTDFDNQPHDRKKLMRDLDETMRKINFDVDAQPKATNAKKPWVEPKKKRKTKGEGIKRFVHTMKDMYTNHYNSVYGAVDTSMENHDDMRDMTLKIIRNYNDHCPSDYELISEPQTPEIPGDEMNLNQRLLAQHFMMGMEGLDLYDIDPNEYSYHYFDSD